MVVAYDLISYKFFLTTKCNRVKRFFCGNNQGVCKLGQTFAGIWKAKGEKKRDKNPCWDYVYTLVDILRLDNSLHMYLNGKFSSHEKLLTFSFSWLHKLLPPNSFSRLLFLLSWVCTSVAVC